MRIPSGSTDRYLSFVAVDATDFVSRETGYGTTGWTVYYYLDDGSATAMTTPTVAEPDSTNMPGVYRLLIDESGMTTLDSGKDTMELTLHITHTGMAPVTRVVEVYRPETTEGNTLDVTSTGAGGIDWNNIENPTTAQNLSGTNIDTDQVVASVSGAVGSVASGGITAASIATGAIDADALAADAIAEILTTQMTEAYSADGVAPTLAQAIFLILQKLTDFSISGTTLTVKKLDGSTTAATFTLDSATNPTSITRAT